MNLVDRLLALRRWWPAAILALVLTTGATLAVGSAQPERYGSTATLIFAVSGGDSATDLNQASTYLQREMTSYARVATSPRVLDPVVKALKLDGTAADLARNVAAVNPTNTVLLDITVTRRNPVEAATIANSIAAMLARVAESMAPSSSGRRLLSITLLSPAQPPTTTAGVPRIAIIGLGNALGAAAAALVLISAARWDRRVWRAADIDTELAGPVLASLPRSSRRGTTDSDPSLLRRAADELVSRRASRRAAMVAVTSTAPLQDDAHVVADLGRAVADIGGRSAVLDLSDASAHEARIVLQRLGGSSPQEDPTGSQVATQMFDPEAAATHASLTDFSGLPGQVDVILLHTPDLATSAAATTLMTSADAAVLVVQAGTGDRVIRRAIDQLTDAAGGRTIPQVGIVLTRVAPRDAHSA